MAKGKTSISIDLDVWKEFRKKCIDVNKDASTVLEELVRKWLKEK
jgi:hypothetical protein